METVLYRRPAVHRRFGVRSEAEVEATAFGMYNQGFYNLFLGLGTLVGVIGTFADWEPQGPTLVVFGCLFMIGAAVVLVAGARPWRVQPQSRACCRRWRCSPPPVL